MKRVTLFRDSFLNRWPVLQTVLAVTLIAFCGLGYAAKGGIPGAPTGGEATNNLSIPGILTESEVSTEAFWSVNDAAVLGEHFSYGCPGVEYYEEFKYPNTSCVDDLMDPSVYYTPEQCVATDRPCAGMDESELSRIYWQKEPLNEWRADDDGVSPNSVAVAYVDWGDALEVVSWNERSVIRVETQPWASTIPAFNPVVANCAQASADALGDPAIDCKVGFEMWHVSGQGITEHWGVRATEPTDIDATISYNFDSPFQIIKSTNARLNVTKMESDSAVCAEPGHGDPVVPPTVGPWDSVESEWEGTCTVYDEPFTVETSVGGKYVYGYNLRMKSVDPGLNCGDDWLKTGFYRLTFYAPDDVMFTHHTNEDPIPNVAPPSVPSVARVIGPAMPFNTVLAPDPGEPEEDDRLYVPKIDPDNNLTYLDICIVAKPQGGGGGGKGGGGRGGGDGGGKGSGKGKR